MLQRREKSKYASSKAVGSSSVFMLEGLKESQRLALPHYHPEKNERNTVEVTVFQSKNRSFNRIALSLPKFWEINELLWFKTAENLFNLNGVNDEKR